jgi:hypothetical protein
VKLAVAPAATVSLPGWTLTTGAFEAGGCDAPSITVTGPAEVLERAPVALSSKWKARGEPDVFFGTLTVTDALPEAHVLVDSAARRCANEKRQVLASWTIARSRTLPPAALSRAGVAVNRPIVAFVTWTVRVGTTIIGAVTTWVGVDAASVAGCVRGPEACVAARTSPAPARHASSAAIARRARLPPAHADSVSVVPPRGGCIVELILAQIRSDCFARG